MAVATWATPGTEASIAGTALNGLATGATSARMAHDNSTALALYARVTIELGSITPAATGSVTLRHLPRRGTTDADITTGLESYTALLAGGAGVKRVIFPLVRLYPAADGFVVVNNAGVAFAASGNAVYVQPFNENIT